MAEAMKTQSPYVRARQEWDERFGDQIKSKNNWRLAAFISMATTFLCVTGMVAIGYRSNTVPYVVALDDVGEVPGIKVPVGFGHNDGGAVLQWPEQLPHRHIEPVRRLEQDLVIDADRHCGPHPVKEGL